MIIMMMMIMNRLLDEHFLKLTYIQNFPHISLDSFAQKLHHLSYNTSKMQFYPNVLEMCALSSCKGVNNFCVLFPRNFKKKFTFCP